MIAKALNIFIGIIDSYILFTHKTSKQWINTNYNTKRVAVPFQLSLQLFR